MATLLEPHVENGVNNGHIDNRNEMASLLSALTALKHGKRGIRPLGMGCRAQDSLS